MHLVRVRVRVRADNLVQPTRRSDDLGAGVDEHVVRVDEHELHSGRRGRALVHVLERGVRPDGHEARRVDDAVRGVDPADLWCHSTMCVTVQAAYRAQERAVCVSVHVHMSTQRPALAFERRD